MSIIISKPIYWTVRYAIFILLNIAAINVTTLSLANNNWVDDRVLSGLLSSLNGWVTTSSAQIVQRHKKLLFPRFLDGIFHKDLALLAVFPKLYATINYSHIHIFMGNKIDLYIYAICRLLEMDLSNTRITSPCVAHLLPDMRHLTSLGLQGILLNDDDLIFLTDRKSVV